MIFNWIMGLLLVALAAWAFVTGDRMAGWGFLVIANVCSVAAGLEARIMRKLEARK